MKKIISVILILLFFYNSLGYIIIYKHQQSIYKAVNIKKIENQIPIDELKVIKITQGEEKYLQYLDEREIRFKGKMYDLVKVEKHSSYKIIYCVPDEAEDVLEEIFLHNLKQNSDCDEKEPASNNISLIFISDALPAEIFSFNIRTAELKNETFYIINRYSHISKIPSPPPINSPVC